MPQARVVLEAGLTADYRADVKPLYSEFIKAVHVMTQSIIAHAYT